MVKDTKAMEELQMASYSKQDTHTQKLQPKTLLIQKMMPHPNGCIVNSQWPRQKFVGGIVT